MRTAQYVAETNPSYIKGHSLGAAIVKRIASEEPRAHRRYFMYEAPEAEMTTGDSRIRSFSHWLDPVSALDWAARRSWAPGINPHTYRN